LTVGLRGGLAILVLLGGAARANPVDAFGFGARSPAMGGAATAGVDGAAANYYNPAALASEEDIRIDVGYQVARPSLSINGGSQSVDASRALIAGLVMPGQIGPLHLAFGAALHLPDEQLLRTRTYPSGQPRWIYYDNRPQRFFLASCVALRLGDSLELGGGISYMSRTHGTIELDGRVGYPNSDDSDLNLNIDVSLISVRYPTAGVLWRPAPWLEVGATYRGAFVLELDQGFAIHGDLGPADHAVVKDASLSLQSISLDLFQPLQLAFGFAARLVPGLLVTGDVTFQRWSTFDNPASKIVIQYDFKNFNNLVVIPAQAPLEPPYFHDIVVPRLGIEWNALPWLFLRAGYAYEPSPAPEQRGETNFVDNDKHTFSGGVGFTIPSLGAVVPRPLDVDLFLAGTVLPDRQHRKLSAVDPVGDYVSSGSVLSGGLATRWRF
jgi:long-chain fatty acid transport protein